MRRFLTSAIITLCCLTAAAQYSVTCQLNDETGEGIPFATLYVYNSADTATVVAADVSDATGHAALSLKSPGSYELRATFVGLGEERRSFAVSKAAPAAHLGTIVMRTASTMLGEVTVTTQRQLVKSEIDRIAYDIQADADSKTNTVMEMLKKVPLVTVDGQNNVMVRGSSSFKIYKNGHPDPSLSGSNMKEVLKALPANTIKKIEVITDPGAKYDAEGTTTILNIVMMDNSSVTGVTGTLGTRIDQTGSPGVNLNLTTQMGKVVTSVNYGYQYQNSHRSKNFYNSETHYTESGHSLYNTNDSRARVNVHYGDINASWEPDTLNLLSVNFGGMYYAYNGTGTATTRMTDADGALIYDYKSRGSAGDNNFYDLHGRADFQHKTHRKDETLTLSYMLAMDHDGGNQDAEFYDMVNAPMTYTGTAQNTGESLAEHTLQFDWTRPFANHHKFETGIKYINRYNKSHAEYEYIGAPELDHNSRFNHRTQVGAVYLSHTFSKGKWSTREGLRYEYSYLAARFPDGSQDSYHTNLNDWVPDLSIEYKFDWAHSLKANFSTSIRRPGLSYLNPAVDEGPTSRSFGNPYLSSAHIYNVGLTYMQMGKKLTFNINPFFAMSNNLVSSIKYADGDIQVSTYANTLKTRSFSTNAYVQWQIHENTSLMLNGNITYDHYRSNDLGLKNSRWRHFFYTQLTQKLPWKLRMSANCGEWGGGIENLYGYNKGGQWWYGLSLQRSFLKEDRLTVRMGAQNFANTSKWNTWTSYTTQGDYTGRSQGGWPSRSFQLAVSYRFGSLKATVKRTDKTIENNDVMGGSSQGGSSQGGQGGN